MKALFFVLLALSTSVLAQPSTLDYLTEASVEPKWVGIERGVVSLDSMLTGCKF